jgi:hypothetical protein
MERKAKKQATMPNKVKHSKHETRSTKQILISNDKMFKT